MKVDPNKDETIQQKVYKRLNGNPKSIIDIQDGTDLTLKQVSTAISSMMDRGWVKVNGEIKYGTQRAVSLYVKAMPSQYKELSVYRHRGFAKQVYIPHVEKPFSTNELHYGKDGKKWLWVDIEQEAKQAGYIYGHEKNKLHL